jgi:hypothetical protein
LGRDDDDDNEGERFVELPAAAAAADLTDAGGDDARDVATLEGRAWRVIELARREAELAARTAAAAGDAFGFGERIISAAAGR